MPRRSASRNGAERAAVAPATVMRAAMWDRFLDRAAQRREIIRQVRGREARVHGRHATADIDTHGRGDDGLFVGMTLPIVAPSPQCTSGIAAIQRWMNGSCDVRRSCSFAFGSKGTPRIHALTGRPAGAPLEVSRVTYRLLMAVLLR